MARCKGIVFSYLNSFVLVFKSSFLHTVPSNTNNFLTDILYMYAHIYSFVRLFLKIFFSFCFLFCIQSTNILKYIYLTHRGDISTLNGSSLKLVDKYTYLGSSVSSTETAINTWLTKAWTATIGYRSYGSQTWPIK